jgi:hypothetical protein
MAPRGWAALSSRKQWLDNKRESYILACASNTFDAWLTNLHHEYFMTYHWSLEDHEEPDPARSYEEPEPGDNNGIFLKEKKINARKDVCLKNFHHVFW